MRIEKFYVPRLKSGALYCDYNIYIYILAVFFALGVDGNTSLRLYDKMHYSIGVAYNAVCMRAMQVLLHNSSPIQLGDVTVCSY